MAFIFNNDKGNIKIILRHDDALDLENSDYDSYKLNLDESFLKFLPNKLPTRFVLRRLLNYESQQVVRGMQISIEGSGKGMVQKLNYSFMMEEIRRALVDIENPPNIENVLAYKKHHDGYASEELITILDQLNIVPDLYNMRFEFINRKSQDVELLKKS